MFFFLTKIKKLANAKETLGICVDRKKANLGLVPYCNKEE